MCRQGIRVGFGRNSLQKNGPMKPSNKEDLDGPRFDNNVATGRLRIK